MLSCDCDMASVHALLSAIPLDLPLEKLLEDARRLHQLYPPSALQPEVAKRVSRLEEEARAESQKRLRRHRREEAKRNGTSLAWRFLVAVAVPVVIGAITWKYLEGGYGAMYAGISAD